MIEVKLTTCLDKFKHISLNKRSILCLPNKGDKFTIGSIPLLEVYAIHHRLDDEHTIEIELHIPKYYANGKDEWPKWVQETYF